MKDEMKKMKEKTLAIVSAIVLTVALLARSSVYASGAAANATVLNAAPTVDVGLMPDDEPAMPGVQVINSDPTTNKTVTITANVTDMNGWDDLTGVVTATITGPSVVEGSPVNLSFDSVVNETTATYTGSFNMSNHSEGDYKVEVTATDFDGLTCVGSMNFTYSYAICELPDLVITDVGIAKVGKKTRIYYNITNVGTERAPPSYTNLTVDGVFVARDHVKPLKPAQSSTERFKTYEWVCTAPNNTVTVCADYENSIAECIETNNCRTELWSCTNIVISFFKAIAQLFPR